MREEAELDSRTAKEFVNDLRVGGRADQYEAEWKDRMHVATTVFRRGVIRKLSRDVDLQEDGSIALAEIFLSEELPEIDHLHGILDVDDVGIWYYDGDGHIDEPV